MIETFLRPARSPAGVGADALRGLGTLSVLLAAIGFGLTDAAIVALTLPGLYFPRFMGMRPWVDLVFSGTLLIAAWSNVLDLYTSISWWDIAVHFMCTGVLAAGVYLLLAHGGLVPAPGSGALSPTAGLLFTTAFGLALCALWEMLEWCGSAFISAEIHTGYDDTIGDMAVGGLGALCAGLAVAFLPLLRTVPPALANRPPG